MNLIGKWKLVSREGSDNPPRSIRVFYDKDDGVKYTWDDKGREPDKQHEEGVWWYGMGHGVNHNLLHCEHDGTSESYRVHVHRSIMIIHRMLPTVGLLAIYTNA